MVSPGFTQSELSGTISDADVRAQVEAGMAIAMPASAIGAAIAYAVGQPSSVDVNELVIRPAAQQ